MKHLYPVILTAALLICLVPEKMQAQTLTDGPIQLQVKLREYQYTITTLSDFTLNVGSFNLPGSISNDEVCVRAWARDNADVDGVGWGPLGGTPHNHSFGSAGLSSDFNDLIYNYTFTGATVPQFFDVRIDAFENDIPDDFAPISGVTQCGSSGSSTTFESNVCCLNLFGCVFSEDDDNRCNAQPYVSNLNYRLGAPCSWYSHGFLNNPTACSGNNYYRPHIESFWRYTNGTSCANAIDLGTITTGTNVQHFNSNECYSNTHTASPGNDVWYKFHANGPVGITASLCGANGAQFDSYLYLYNSCGASVPDTANDNGCGTQSTLSYSICQAGDYYLVVDGKTATDFGLFTLFVQENPGFVFSVTPQVQDVSCFGNTDGQITANVQGGAAPYTYTWNPAQGNVSTATGLAGGNYSVSVTDSKGCQISATATVNVPAQISATTTTNPVSCGGSCDGSATVTAQGGSTPYSYSWNSLPPQQLATATLLCANTYTVTVTDANSCSVTATATVANTTTVVIGVDSVNNVQCNGLANGGVYLTVTGGQTPYQFAWSNSVNTEDNPNLGPGTYTVTITDNIGCTTGDTYTITEPTLLTSTVSFTFNPRCNTGSDGIVNIAVAGGEQPYTYQWSAPSNATTQNLNNVTAGTHTVTVTDANACTATSTATLTEPSPYTIALTNTDLLCNGGTNGTAGVTVSGATGPYTYFWSNFSTTPTTTGLYGGPFSVVIEDANGCDTIVTGTVNEPAEILVVLTTQAPLCADSGNGTITTLVNGGTSPYNYSWTGPNGFTSTQANPQVSSGTYQVTVTDANNCTAQAATGVAGGAPLTVTLVDINPNCIGDSTGAVTASITGGEAPYSYSWSTGATGSSAYIEKLAKGSYAVTVTDANGCSANSQATLVDPQENPASCTPDKYVILVPTAFTPNGDNINDRLVVIMRNVQRLEFHVFNRWGEEVYKNLNMLPGDGWDGMFRGKEQPMGNYVWIANVTYLNGVQASERNSSILIR